MALTASNSFFSIDAAQSDIMLLPDVSWSRWFSKRRGAVIAREYIHQSSVVRSPSALSFWRSARLIEHSPLIVASCHASVAKTAKADTPWTTNYYRSLISLLSGHQVSFLQPELHVIAFELTSEERSLAIEKEKWHMERSTFSFL